MNPIVTINKDVSGADYTSLVATACERYSQFSLVWRDQLSFDPSARSIQHELRRFQITRSRTSHWPGTQLIGTRADVIRYSIGAARTGVLSRSGSLFGWRSPDFPEDLCFYSADGSCTIATVSHEQTAWFFERDWHSLLPASAAPQIEQIPDADLQLLQPNA